MKCDKCESERIMEFMGKTSDLCHAEIQGTEYDGECPKDLGIGSGDYIRLSYCLDCGKIQGTFPIKEPQFVIDAQEDNEE